MASAASYSGGGSSRGTLTGGWPGAATSYAGGGDDDGADGRPRFTENIFLFKPIFEPYYL